MVDDPVMSHKQTSQSAVSFVHFATTSNSQTCETLVQTMKGILCWLALAASVVGTRGGNTSCTVSASPVLEGQFVSITCSFSQDLKGESVHVTRTAPDNNEPQGVLECEWNNSSTSHNCKTQQPGYQTFQGVVGSEVRLVISRVSKSHDGQYLCHILGQEKNGQSPCTLTVHETAFDTSCDSPSVTKGVSANVTCYFNKDVRQSRVEFAVIREPLVAGEHNSGTLILDCFWSREHLNYTLGPGYTVNTSEISSLLTLHIASSSEEHEGRYTCKVSSSVVAKETSCYFRLKGISSEAPGQDEHKEVVSGDGEAEKKAIAISTLFFTLLILVFIGIVIVSVTVTRCMKKQQTDGHGHGHELENLNGANEPLQPPAE